jgi:hypothetical protein
MEALLCLAVPALLTAAVLIGGVGSKSGVYVWRTRKPGAWFGWPIVGRHTAYVGQTSSFAHRRRQHLGTPAPWDAYATRGQPWSDLSPRCYEIPLAPWKWWRKLVEYVLTKILLPVYPVQYNKWNPRRISQPRAIQMRMQRERAGTGSFGLGVRVIGALRWYHFAGTVALGAGCVGLLS